MNTETLTAGYGTVTADMLRATFDNWRIFEHAGIWWASRPGEIVEEGPRSLIHPVVFALTLEALGDQLSMQEWLRRMPVAELESVWRGGFTAVEA